jgi:Spy/CpxP family protein refolding chaperone
MYRQAFRTGLVALGLIAAGAVMAQPAGYGYGYGPGPGMGPGMMGGYGPGPGMGPGMMGGYGPGASYGGTAPLSALNLSSEQQGKVLAIQEENRGKNWDTMGRVRAEQFKLRNMYNADELDPQAFAEQQKKVDDLRREMIVSRLETRKQIEGVLTPEQRQQFRQFGPRWLGESDVE